MSFRIGRRHWSVFVLLFLVNLIVLVVKIPFGAGVDVRVLVLMIACSALVSFLVALLLVALFDRMSRSQESK
jgi:hypothetical protein